MTRLLIAGLVATIATPALAENWPQWRGPTNDGHSTETSLPIEWGPDKNIVWKLKLPGLGESSPCVWGNRIFFTSTAGDDVILLCVGTDGQEKWRQQLSKTGKERNGPDKATDASASCLTDGKHVWSYVGGKQSGRLTCHNLDGKLLWEKNLQDYGKFEIQFGTHWTPTLYDGKLYLQVMHRNAQKLVRLDGATGKQEWVVERPGASKGESPDVYASPFIWAGDGGPLLIAHGNDFCTAHRLTDGIEVWRVEGLNPTNNRAWRFVASPLCTPDLIVIPSCKNGPVVGINPIGAHGTINPDNSAELWRINGTPDVVSPLRVGDVVYLCADGPLTAIEAKTGKQIYRESRERQIHRPNMVTANGKVYIVGREGKTDVVQAGREFKILAKNTLPDKFSASPAISGGRIYLRGAEYLWAIGGSR